MGRLYTVPWSGTLTNAGGDTDLWELTPADDKPIKLRGFILAQTSEVGDTAEEGLRISIIRLPATVTSGSGGSAVTPALVKGPAAAAGFTAEVNNTTIATTSGTALTIIEMAWNVRNVPFDFWLPDEPFSPDARGAEVLVVRCQTTPADDISVAMTAFVEED